MKQIDLGKFNNQEFKQKTESSSSQDEIAQDKKTIFNNKSKELSLNTKKHSRLNKILLFLIILLLIAGIAFFFLMRNSFGSIEAIYSDVHKVFSNCSGSDCQTVKIDNPTCTGIFCAQRELPQTDGKTNILILGVDALGDKSGNNQGSADWMLTDVIMVASYNHRTGYLTMISIPRDTEATYKNYYGNTETTKINAVYSNTGWGYGQKNHEKAVAAVSEQVTKITNLPIHYSALITFTGFKEIIDSIGGVSINVENDIMDYYPLVQLSAEYKKKNCKIVYVEDGNYCQWSLKAGTYQMNGEEALVYARSRKHSTDWDRARRQQIVIDAVRQKVLSSDTLLNPTKLTDIINSVQNNIKLSSYDANDIVAALQLKDKYKGMASVVIDPNFVSGAIVSVSGSSDYKIVNLSNIQNKLTEIQNNPLIYKESAIVFEYFTGSKANLANSIYSQTNDSNIPLDITQVPGITGIEQTFSWSKVVNISESSTSSNSDRKVYFYDFTNGQKLETKKLLESFGATEIKLIEGMKLRNYNTEDFAIIWK